MRNCNTFSDNIFTDVVCCNSIDCECEDCDECCEILGEMELI